VKCLGQEDEIELVGLSLRVGSSLLLIGHIDVAGPSGMDDC